MDVVYNHVNGWQGSNFDVLMPYYYFRYNSDGTASNGSGCGNETASDMYMFRKFMIDSTTFWAKEYKLGGFRFDLMGLHDLTTMNELTAKCKEINPNICIYGEPWTGGDSPLDSAESAKQANGNDYEGYGQFNDHMRDNLIAGGLNSATTKAWATDSSALHESSSIQMGLKGTTLVGGANTIKDPDKTTNYVTCHDNYTLYDRIVASGTTDESVIRKMAVLANSVVFTSQGTSFMLAGEEFLRTKGGNSNSYNASYALNALDYSLKVKNLDMFKTYQKLISLKENFAGLHLAKTEANKLDIQLPKGNELMYDLSDTASNKTYRIVHVSGYNVSADQTADFAGYTLYLDTLNPSTPLTLSATTKLSPYQTIIAYKNITA
jgi:pullulanase